MNLVYHSTRNSEETATASEAILKGLTSDGGLFVPDSIPKLNVSLEDLTKMSYQEIAYAVMKEFLTDFTEDELKNCIANAYDAKFDTEEIAPLTKSRRCLLSGAVPRRNDRVQGHGTFHSAASDDDRRKEKRREK